MTPQEYIDGLQMAVRDFDIIADEAIRAVGIDFFKTKYREANGLTLKVCPAVAVPNSIP